LVEVKPGKKFSLQVLKDLLPDVETILFFGKVYELDYRQLSKLLYSLKNTDVATALSEGGHSVDLQDYLVDDIIPYVPDVEEGDIAFDATEPAGEILPQVWESLEVEIAASIKAVADKLSDVIGLLPGKQGHLAFSSMLKLNRQRPVLGAYTGQVKHAHQGQNLVILDVSGSMTEDTIRRIVQDVVALSWKADAHMAIVSNTCTYWQPGAYSVDEILAKAEYGGTHYEMLSPLFENRDWSTVVTVADYDSSRDAKRVLSNCTGRIEQVLDISLVDRPTYLAECVGQLAAEVRPILIAQERYQFCG
jgi:hypothetical protein